MTNLSQNQQYQKTLSLAVRSCKIGGAHVLLEYLATLFFTGLLLKVCIGMSEEETFSGRLGKVVLLGIETCQKSAFSIQNHKIL